MGEKQGKYNQQFPCPTNAFPMPSSCPPCLSKLPQKVPASWSFLVLVLRNKNNNTCERENQI